MQNHINEPKRFALNMSAAQFTKFYILFLLSTNTVMYSEQFKEKFKEIGGKWSPAPSTLHDTLYEMTNSGLLYREESKRGKRQRIYLYRLSEAGREEFTILKKKYYSIFTEQKSILERILKEIY